MSKVIVFCGLSGSGKTTLAREVSKKLNVVCLHKDSIKESLYDLSGGKTLEDSQRIGKQSILLLMSLAEEMIRNSVDIMIESPFNHPDNPKQIEGWQEQYSIDLRVVVCSVNEDERKQRFETRVRHPGHHDKKRLNLYPFSTGDFDYSVFPGKKLFLDTSQPMAESIQKIADFLD